MTRKSYKSRITWQIDVTELMVKTRIARVYLCGESCTFDTTGSTDCVETRP